MTGLHVGTAGVVVPGRPVVGPGEQRETRRRIVARGRDLRLSPGERVSVFAHRRLENGSSGMTGSSAHAEVSVELVCVFPAERRGVLLQPFEERYSPERRLVRDQQPSGQAADLWRSATTSWPSAMRPRSTAPRSTSGWDAWCTARPWPTVT
jgi:hypothetical protein